MRILVSAYACEPDRGSEPGQGWNWAVAWARLGHEVWVLTCRAHHQAAIAASLADRPLPPDIAGRLRFVFHDPAGWPGPGYATPRFVRSHYLAWQWTVAALARALHERVGFDLVHHVSWGVVRQPSFLGGLGVPLVFGPVGGAERAPRRLRAGFSPRGRMMEVLRDALNGLVRVDPLMHRTFSRSAAILCKTPESAALVPAPYRHKTRIFLEVFIDPAAITGPRADIDARPFRVLHVGRLLSWKGGHLALRAFARLAATAPDARLTMVGQGPERARLHALAAHLGIAHRVTWHDWMPQHELHALYRAHSVFLFPSLHDSSGNVVLESLAHGLPVVCLDLGGPGQMVDDGCGQVVATGQRSVSEVVDALGDALQSLYGQPDMHRALSRGAHARALEFSADVRPPALLDLLDSLGVRPASQQAPGAPPHRRIRVEGNAP